MREDKEGHSCGLFYSR